MEVKQEDLSTDNPGKLRKPRQKKCKKLSIKEKLHAIELFENGVSKSEISLQLGVTLTAICYVIRNKEKYIRNGQSELIKTKTRIDEGENPVLEKILLEWIKQKRSLNIPINGPLIKERALYINNKLLKRKREELENSMEEKSFDSEEYQQITAMEKFKASQGWLHRFKTRNGMLQVTCKGEKASADEDRAQSFKEEMKTLLEEHDYSIENIYNADETGLYDKMLPKKTLELTEQKEEFGFKECNERVTIIVCANATGTHQIPLLLIGKSQNPRSFKQIKDKLPLIYKAQKCSSMTREIFLDWYQNIFIPCVKERKPGVNEKFLLLLDNAPCHPSAEELSSIDPQFKVKYLPSNVTSLIQPMNQGVIESMKRHYKKYFLQKLLFEDSNNSSVILNFIKKWKLLNTVFLIASAWNCVTQETLSKAWKNLLGTEFTTNSSDLENEEIIKILEHIHSSETYSSSDIDEWIAEDDSISVCRKMSLNQVIEQFTGNVDSEIIENQEIKEEILSESDGESSNEENEDPLASESEAAYNKAKKARRKLLDLQKWVYQRPNVSSEDIKSIYHLQTAIEEELYVAICRRSM